MIRYETIIFLIVLFSFTGSASNAEQFTDKVKEPVNESITIRQKNQKDVEKWGEEKSKLEAEFESLLETRKQLTGQRDRMIEEIRSREKRVVSLEKQVISAEKISDRLPPFLEKIINRIGRLLDQPPVFLLEERSKRLENLEKTLDDPQISSGEKFRKVMEAVFVEAEYGNTVEVYQQKITFEKEEILVHVLRLGRLSLFFETLDQKTCGFFDIASGEWRPLPPSANRNIHTAIEIASRRRPADIVSLPVGRIVVK